jgi:hypothetical protein
MKSFQALNVIILFMALPCNVLSFSITNLLCKSLDASKTMYNKIVAVTLVCANKNDSLYFQTAVTGASIQGLDHLVAPDPSAIRDRR